MAVAARFSRGKETVAQGDRNGEAADSAEAAGRGRGGFEVETSWRRLGRGLSWRRSALERRLGRRFRAAGHAGRAELRPLEANDSRSSVLTQAQGGVRGRGGARAAW